MVTVQLIHGDFAAVITVDADPHPDLLDELTTRCKRLFLETQAELPEDSE
jgi:hypothetical protein